MRRMSVEKSYPVTVEVELLNKGEEDALNDFIVRYNGDPTEKTPGTLPSEPNRGLKPAPIERRCKACGLVEPVTGDDYCAACKEDLRKDHEDMDAAAAAPGDDEKDPCTPDDQVTCTVDPSGIRNINEDRESIPPIVAIKHMVTSALENDVKTFSGFTRFLYGDAKISPSCKLFRELNDVWKGETK